METKQFFQHLAGATIGFMLLIGETPNGVATAAHTSATPAGAVERFVFEKVRGSLPEGWKKHAPGLSRTILQQARKHDFDPLFLMAVIQTESGFRPWIRGSAGEIGLMQIKPSTAAWISRKAGIAWHGPKTLEDPSKNVQIGAAYLAMLRKQFKHRDDMTYVAAYNLGSAKLRSMLDQRIVPVEYTMRVSGHYVVYFTEYGKTHNRPSGRLLASVGP